MSELAVTLNVIYVITSEIKSKIDQIWNAFLNQLKNGFNKYFRVRFEIDAEIAENYFQF